MILYVIAKEQYIHSHIHIHKYHIYSIHIQFTCITYLYKSIVKPNAINIYTFLNAAPALIHDVLLHEELMMVDTNQARAAIKSGTIYICASLYG